MEDKNEWFKKRSVTVYVEIGRDKKPIKEVLGWRRGSTIKLTDSVVNILPIYVNNKKIGEGSVLRKQNGEMDLQIDRLEEKK